MLFTFRLIMFMLALFIASIPDYTIGAIIPMIALAATYAWEERKTIFMDNDLYERSTM